MANKLWLNVKYGSSNKVIKDAKKSHLKTCVNDECIAHIVLTVQL